MTVTWTLFALAGVAAVANWIAVDGERTRVEHVAKPATLALLTAAVVALPADRLVSEPARTWFVVALLFSLAGDVFLMLPSDRFVPGLASFLVGHIAYIGGLLHLGSEADGIAVPLVVAIAVVAVGAPVLGRRIVLAVRRGPEPALAAPVVAYMVVISAMVIAAGASGAWIALAGAISFYASDATIAWTRFLQPFDRSRVVVMVTYHLAQAGLVLALW